MSVVLPVSVKCRTAVIAAMIFIFTVAGCSSSAEVNYEPPAGSAGPAINHFSFSKIVVDGKTFSDVDVAISAKGKAAPWQIGRVHVVEAADIDALVTPGTRVLIIGTGTEGATVVKESALARARDLKAEVHVLDTAAAVRLFNESPKEGLAGAFHTGC